MSALEHSRDGFHMEPPTEGDVVTPNTHDIPDFESLWNRASEHAPFHSLSLEDYRRIPVNNGVYRRLCLYRRVDSGRGLVLPCAGITRKHRFAIGARRLFTVKAPAVNLLNYWVLEGHAPEEIASAIGQMLKRLGADIFTLSDVPEGSALDRAMTAVSWPMVPLVLNREPMLHWLADLPEDFETYVAGLSKRTRNSVRRQMRQLDAGFDVRLETVTRPDQVERFLTEAERINRKTYQWALGERVENTPETREHFLKLAAEDRLRSYLLLLDGEAVAFEYGRLEGRFYLGEASSFDPAYSDHGVGIVLMLRVMRDLIETTTCRIYDFGMGGDEAGYKARYGNRSVTCNSYYILRLDRPRGLAIWTLQTVLNTAKTAGMWLVGDGAARNGLRKLLRKS